MIEKPKSKKTVRLLGGVARDDDWQLSGADHFALNNHYRVLGEEPPVTAWFQMHSRHQVDNHRNGADCLPWLRKKHKFPIYMSHRRKDVPSAKVYPKKDAEKLWTLAEGPVFSDTFCYMIALAILQGYERIDLYGIHLGTPVEAYLEAPAAGIWIGMASARGIAITGKSRMLKKFSYGYDDRIPPPWVSREVAALTFMDEVPTMKRVLAGWECDRFVRGDDLYETEG